MNDYRTLSGSDAGESVQVMRCPSFAIPFPKRWPRLTGDTRRRKRRLRKKLEKLDELRYAPAMRAIQVAWKRRLMDNFARMIIADMNDRFSQRSQQAMADGGWGVGPGEPTAKHAKDAKGE